MLHRMSNQRTNRLRVIHGLVKERATLGLDLSHVESELVNLLPRPVVESERCIWPIDRIDEPKLEEPPGSHLLRVSGPDQVDIGTTRHSRNVPLRIDPL